MNFKKSLLIVILAVVHLPLLAQVSPLELEQVISITLENNLDLRISNNYELAADRLATKSQANYLPTISFNSSANYSNSNTKLEFAGGIDPVEVNGAEFTALAAGIGLNYVIFNGFGRINSYRMLINNQRLTEVQSRVLAENLILQTVNTFLDIQQSELDIEIAVENLKISEDRVKRTSIAVESGAKNKLDLLNAEVDLNNDSIVYKSLIIEQKKLIANLNVLMGRDPNSELSLSDATPIPNRLNNEEVLEFTLSNNASILLAQIAADLNANSRSVIQSAQFPQLTLNATYGIESSKNGAGIVLSQNNIGFSGGLNLSIPIYSGGQLVTAIQNADLELLNSELEMDKTVLSLKNEVYSAQLDEELLKASIASLEENVELAGAALKRAQISYGAGQISSNDLRQAQLNYIISKSNLNQANMNLIRLYYAVGRLTGSLTN